jgi:AhpD family alkylhydroperoxidase
MNEPTIAELHGLREHDPWDRRTDRQKAQDAFRQQLRDALQDPAPFVMPAFVDPPDDDDPSIRDGSPRVFHRLTISDHKLAALLTREPNLISIAVAACNTCRGCWVALTSHRIAGQMAERLRAQGLAVELESVNSSGVPVGRLTDEQRDAAYHGLVGSDKFTGSSNT